MKIQLLVTLSIWLACVGAIAIQEPGAKTLAKRSTGAPRHFPVPKYFRKSTSFLERILYTLFFS